MTSDVGPTLTHLDASGRVQRVEVGHKPLAAHLATAQGQVRMSERTLEAILAGQGPKGNVVEAARLAGIMAAKCTADLIPLCHPLPLTSITVDLDPDPHLPGFLITATAKTTAQTGVEMEALTAVAVAALTLYDMAKALEKAMVIENIRLLCKYGGSSGPSGFDQNSPSQ
ncbi:cyclic pyranopterin monophosphate synthase MoaC [Synechococcus sp. H55.7]|uniref:cyclic pyranopterin monophosphate synthase MoaC n=1 Tax=unclassified Synechococcus TaxID=2626047 RepID=UPI0039C2AC19